MIPKLAGVLGFVLATGCLDSKLAECSDGTICQKGLVCSPFRDECEGAGPYAVAVGNLNGDGGLALVVANTVDNNVSVLLGTSTPGHLSFRAQPHAAAGRNPRSLVLADLRGVGTLDIVVANVDDGTVSVLIGDGAGFFPTAVPYAVGAKPTSLAIADLDGDDKLDIITADFDDDAVSILYGNGKGAFERIPQVLGIGKQPNSVAVADVNCDGALDLVVADHDGVSVFLREPHQRAFAPGATLVAGEGFSALAIRDLDGDAKPDIVVTNTEERNVSVFLGLGDGSFQMAATYPVGNTSDAQPVAVALAELDEEGGLDLVVANLGGDEIETRHGDGGGGFAPISHVYSVPAPVGVVTADIDGDGHLDLVVPSSVSDEFSIRLGDGMGTFGRARGFPARHRAPGP